MTAQNVPKKSRITHLEDARMEAFSPPKQDRATAKGIVQFITPNTLSANVWREKIELLTKDDEHKA